MSDEYKTTTNKTRPNFKLTGPLEVLAFVSLGHHCERGALRDMAVRQSTSDWRFAVIDSAH